jgi:hypothetical protein
MTIEISAGSELKVDVRALIEFFDVNTDARPDASSIKAILGEELAVACMVSYFASKGAKAGLLMQDARKGYRLACTTGEQKGFQLDGWFLVEENGGSICYQMEVKSWSFHGIGGSDQRLLITQADTQDDLQKKKHIFSRYYDAQTKALIHPGTRKVLLKMKQPEGTRNNPRPPTHNPLPLLCLWAPVCRAESDIAEIFFRVPVRRLESTLKENGAECQPGGFDELYVFSVSNYLRTLLANTESGTERITVSLALPRVAERLKLLASIFLN